MTVSDVEIVPGRKPLRQRIYEIIDVSDGSDPASTSYDYFMVAVVIISLVPLAFKHETPFFRTLDLFAVAVFIIDYLLGLLTADYRFGGGKINPFVRYPFSFWAIIDLLSILPSITMLNSGWRVIRVVRMARALRVLRVLRAFRYSKSIRIISAVFLRSRAPLLAVGTLAVTYILVSALVMFNVEPDTFHSFFEAVYWATISLTTIGYGDIHPETTFGRAVTIVSSLFGIAVVALPAGIIAGGFMREVSEESGEPADTDPDRPVDLTTELAAQDDL